MIKFSQIFEEVKIPEDHIDENDPKFHEKLSKKLIEDQHIHPDDRFYLKSFTTDADYNLHHEDNLHNAHASSRQLNKDLIEHGEPKRLIDKRMHEAIMNNVSPAKREFHLYSGTRINFGKLAKQSKDEILYSPAHISASSALHIAEDHIRKIHNNNKKDHHIVHIHVQRGDPYLHISHLSRYEDEHETVVPSGTKLKYSHSEKRKRQTWEGPVNFHMHHFTIVGDNK